LRPQAGNNQKGAAGSQLTLSVTLNPGSSGGTASGGAVFFTPTRGTLSSRIVDTDSTGKASVVLTLPAKAGVVHVTAEGRYALGHPAVTFTEACAVGADLSFGGDSQIISASAGLLQFANQKAHDPGRPTLRSLPICGLATLCGC